MEPILPAPAQPEGGTLPDSQGSLAAAETAPNTQPEQSREGLPQQSAPPTATPVLPVAPPLQPVGAAPQPQASDPASTSAPLIADDVDVIEKEWVEKAKKIVSATKEDPHTQEKEVSKLQADYLQKRYNKTIKVPE